MNIMIDGLCNLTRQLIQIVKLFWQTNIIYKHECIRLFLSLPMNISAKLDFGCKKTFTAMWYEGMKGL